MCRKLILSVVLLFSSTIISDLAQKSKLLNPDFDFTKAIYPNKKNSAGAIPFWETSKKSNAVDTAALKQSNWYADVIKNIEASEYEIHKDDKREIYAAPNRQQQLRASFTYNSFTLRPRSTDQTWILIMQLSGIYADKALVAKPDKKDLPVIGSNKIVFNNTNFSTEYINSKEGIRQNFIIIKKPAGKSQTININLQTNKDWYVNKVHDKELHFAKVEGDQLSKKITYNSLKVWDANNKELDAKFVVNKKHDAFEIEVNAENAVYPITIDPLSASPATTLNGITSGDYFGNSVASAGDVDGNGYSDVIVGAYGVASSRGSAYLFLGSATGLSSSPATTLIGLTAGDKFGFSVASAGDVNGDGYSDVIIGASGRSSNTGAAYLFLGSSGGLSSAIATTLNGVSNPDSFGSSVASAGDVNGDTYSDVIIGANARSSNTGAAYLFLGSGTGLSSTIATTLNGITAGDKFGFSVASAGDVNGDGFSDVIIGANGRSSNTGAAYLFHGSGTGLSATIVITLNGIAVGDNFGYSVASAGDVNGNGYSDVIVGAYLVSSGTGAAYQYPGSAAGIVSSATTLNGIVAGGNFGVSVSCVGDINGDGFSDVMVGAEVVSTSTGAAYLFLGSATGLPASPSTTLSGLTISCSFGFSLASSGDINGDGYSDIVISAPNLSINTGAAYTYHGSPNGLKTTSNWQVLETQGGANYGFSVASAGDVNSDGFSDVLVGAYIYDDGLSNNGKAWLYMGSAAGLSTTLSWTAIGSMSNEYMGSCVAAAGDVNGDGYGDVLVGAYGYTNSQSEEGRAYLYYGSAGGLSGAFAWTYENNVATSILGRSLAAAGDVNGDGYGDIIIGAPHYNSGGEVNEGKAYVFHGSATFPATTASWSVESNQTGAWYGFSVASLGDVNGDGFSDIIIGAHLYDDVLADEGKAFAYYGSATGLSLTWTARGGQLNAQFGISVASAGDVNGDGFSDAIVGALNYNNGIANEGAAFVYYGSLTVGLSLTANWTGDNNIPNTYFAYSVSSAGDVNGDGYSDVLIGAREISNVESREGAMYAYYGSSTGLSLTTSWYVESNVATSLLGNGVASAGDVNGDGYSDVIGAAPYYGSLAGAAFVYYGNNNTGLRHNLKLYNTDLSTPINRGSMFVPNLFGAGLFSKSPLGRVKGKLVWEVKQQGQPFSGNPITNSTAFLDKQPSYTDLGTAGTELKYNVLKQGRQNKIRVRVEYDKATAITGQVYGPWRYPPAYLQGAHGMGSVPLPVKLNSFTGALISGKVKLEWLSADDQLVARYQIERSSNNSNFAAIGTIPSVHQNSKTYNFTDDRPLKGTSWYRLKITDEYNRINYSGTIIIKNTNDAVWIYPTVIGKGERVNLQFKNNITGTLGIQLANSGGAVVFKNQIIANSNIIPVELPSLSSGVYILSAIQNGEKLITHQIIIR